MTATVSPASVYAGLVVNGLVLGAVFAILAIGVVVVYRTTRTLNLAQGGLATIGGATYLSLRSHGAPTLLALVVTAAIGVAVGLGIGEGIGWPLRRAGTTTKLVASLGVLLLVQSFIAIVFGSTPEQAPPLVSGHVIDVLGVRVVVDRLLVLGLVGAGLVLLNRLFDGTRFGLQMRCVAIDSEAAALQGVNVRMVTLASWMLGVGVAFVGGVLLATVFSQVEPLTLTIVLLQALGATLVGRIESLGAALAGGLLLGVLVTFGEYWFLSITGISDVVVFGFILVVLLAQRPDAALAERA